MFEKDAMLGKGRSQDGRPAHEPENKINGNESPRKAEGIQGKIKAGKPPVTKDLG